MNIGSTITELRTARGLTQQAFADLLYVSRELVSKWENGTRRPDYDMIERLAQVLEVSPDAIVDKNDLVFEELADCIPDGVTVGDAELTAAIESFLRGIGENEARLFIRRYYFLEAPADISAAFGKRENYVRSVLSKTRAKFRKFIKERAS